MEPVPDIKNPAYSPTSTPILDVVRPVPAPSRGRLSSGEYFFISSLIILVFMGLPEFSRMLAVVANASASVWLAFAAIPAAAFCFALGIHEFGHFVGGLASGFQLVRRHQTYDAHQLQSRDVIPLSLFGFAPRTRDHLRGRLFTLSAGGPLCSLVLGIALRLSPAWHSPELLLRWWVECLSGCSVLIGIAALLPDMRPNGAFSDGARLLMLANDDQRAGRWLANIQMQLALLKGQHPRQWEQTWIVRATSIDDDSRDAVTARWLAYLWASERQDITSATRFLEEALLAPASSLAPHRDRLFLEAACFQGWFRENSAKARSWATQMRNRRANVLEQQRLDIVLLWADGKSFDAWEKMGNYIRLLSSVSESPVRELATRSAQEWKHQMESRMLTRAWRMMYTMSQQVDLAAGTVAAESHKITSC